MVMFDSQTTLCSLRDAIAGRRVSASEVVRQSLDRIESLDAKLHACNEVFADRAMQRAKDVDAGKVTGPLSGVPITIKDNLCTTVGHTTCSSKMLANFRSPYDATVVRKLEAAGAIILAKTNLDEFAMGSSTENSSRGPTRNPWDVDHVPGGSSGGAAAAVAARFGIAAIGSDTGGSIRQPAALCGVVGFKPTYGTVSRYGLVAFASSLDQIGPLTVTVEDAAMLMNVIAGHDPKDSTSSPRASMDFTSKLHEPVEKLRLGVPEEYLSDANHPDVKRVVNEVIDRYRGLGAQIVPVHLPHTEYGIPTYYIVATAEASSNLARYDGIHYGHRAEGVEELVELYAASRAEGFGEEVKRRIMLGTYALSSGYYDAYYLRALKARRRIKQDFDAAFAKCDAIVGPVTTCPAFRFGQMTDDPLQMYLNDVYTVNCNLAGLPGLSMPAGFSESEGVRLPIGVQLLGPASEDATLLRIAQMIDYRSEIAPLEG